MRPRPASPAKGGTPASARRCLAGAALALAALFAARAQGEGGGPLVLGDSIAAGVRAACGCAGRARVGAGPAEVLRFVLAASSLRGRRVILSTGASNDPFDFDSVEAQLLALYRARADVVVLGLGRRFAHLNPRLQLVAVGYGARFLALGPNDGVHPFGPRGYQALARAAGAGLRSGRKN